MARLVLSVAAMAGMATGAMGQLTFEFSSGPGLDVLKLTEPDKAAAMLAGAEEAGKILSKIFKDKVTLKVGVDYAPALPALGVSFAEYMPGGVEYSAVKAGLISKVTSPFDGTAVMHLQDTPELKIWRNDTLKPPFTPFLDAGATINNIFMDVSKSNAKALGVLGAKAGGAASDGTIAFGSAKFDFTPFDGIEAGHYDFVGVALHELMHNMGFVSGVDSMATFLPPDPFSPGKDPDPEVMVTVLDLYRYSPDSVMAGMFVPDLSLPVPGLAPMRFFSIDGGFSIIDLFSTGTKLLGDGEGGGHWKMDGMFGLMDPKLGAGVPLTAKWLEFLTGPAKPDLIAMDVIGWTVVPTPGAAGLLLGLGCVAGRRRGR